MRRFCFWLTLIIFIPISGAFSQGGTWTWISGDSAFNSTGVFGTQGTPSVSNHPPALYEPCEWKDKQGNLWIYGGELKPQTFASDLWKFNPVTKEWTWVKGNGLANQTAVYGTQRMPNSSNTPGMRPLAAATWVDTSGALWLFGGGLCSNDLWKYDIGSNKWTWMKGNNVSNSSGVHGTQGIPNPSNNPGTRLETCSAWTDSANNLWLFGGLGYDDNGNNGLLNDLCKYNIASNQWTWMKGSAYINAPAAYGTKGIANTTNDPGGRYSYNKWKDLDGNFWLMGGSPNYTNCFNDVWKYDLSTNDWIWMNGTSLTNNSGAYHSKCAFDSTNLPFSRSEQRSSVTDNCGRFWLFGGAEFKLGTDSVLSDLWVFNPAQLTWNLISGSNAFNQKGHYGALGVPSSANMPPSRWGAVAWWGNDNKFYMYGGYIEPNFYSDVWVYDPDTTCIPVSSCNAITPPIADFQSTTTTICVNDCINFTNLSVNATSWQWLFSGALDSTSTDQDPQNICYANAGTYNVTLTAYNAGGSNTVTFNNYISVHPAPIAPFIAQVQDTLFCSTDTSYISYQWYADSTIIIGATDTILVVSKSGNYNVSVANADGCKTAAGVNVTIGIQIYNTDYSFSLYPNPTTGKVTFIYRFENNKVKLQLFDVVGRLVRSYVLNGNKNEFEFDMSDLCCGIFEYQVINNDKLIGIGNLTIIR